MNERGSKWYRMTPDEVAQQLRTDAAVGLSRKAVRSRLKRRGMNTLFDAANRNTAKLSRMIVPDSACVFMLATVIVALFFSNLGTALLALAVTVISTVLLGHIFLQIRRAYADIAKYRIPAVCVMRNRRLTQVSANRIVCGDVILFKAGDIVPCDCRLCSSQGLRVLTLMPNEKGAPVYREFPKNAEKLYAYASGVYAPEHENMLYGGSEILSGSARAIAVETGEHTYLGAMSTFHIPAEVHAGESGEDSIKEIRSYIRVYGFLMLALLLILTLVGVLTAPAEIGILDVFYPLCVLCGVASPMLIMLYFRLIALKETESLLRAAPKENRAVVKVGRITERMNGATDLILLGHKACSDGLLHFSSAFVGMREIGSEDKDSFGALQDLCEAFVLINRSSALTSSFSVEDGGDGTLLRELMEIAHYDTDALNIRLLHVEEKESAQKDVRCIDVQTNTKRFSLIFSENPHIAERCKLYEDDGRLCTFSPQLKQALYAYCENAESNACKAVTVVRCSEDGTLSLVGVVSGCEHVQPSLSAEIDAFEKSGVRLSFFLNGETKYEAAFANACNLPGNRITANDETPRVTEEMLENYRVFIGFSNEDALFALQSLQKQRKCAGVLCGNAEDRRFLNAAAFTVVCESLPMHEKGTEELARADAIYDGCEHSSHAAASMRCHADAVIQRATPEHGGLLALSEFFFGCRSIGLRMRLLLTYLATVNILRLCVALFSTLLGIGLPAGVWMLYSCLLLDAIAVRRILSLKIPRGFLHKPQRITEQIIDRQIFPKEQWLPLLIATGAASLYLAILGWCGVISRAEANAPVFLILLFAQLWVLHTVTDRDGIGYDRFILKLPLLQLLLPLAVLIPLSILLPAVGTVTALGVWNPIALIAVPVFPLAYFISLYFISFLSRTAK